MATAEQVQGGDAGAGDEAAEGREAKGRVRRWAGWKVRQRPSVKPGLQRDRE